MHNGCYRTEPYGAFEHVLPCPSHVICSAITDVDNNKFCKRVKTDFDEKEPKKQSGGAGGAAS
jgi:hypothetical protein